LGVLILEGSLNLSYCSIVYILLNETSRIDKLRVLAIIFLKNYSKIH